MKRCSSEGGHEGGEFQIHTLAQPHSLQAALNRARTIANVFYQYNDCNEGIKAAVPLQDAQLYLAARTMETPSRFAW